MHESRQSRVAGEAYVRSTTLRVAKGDGLNNRRLLIVVCIFVAGTSYGCKNEKNSESTYDAGNFVRSDNIRFKLAYSDNNPRLGLDINNWAYVYEKNIVFEENSTVIAFSKKDDIYEKKHYENEKPLYISPNNTDERVIGLFDHWLFIDGGTSPGPHQLKIFDLSKQAVIFDGDWYTMKKIIDQIDDTTFIVYKYNNDRKFLDQYNDHYVCTLSAYSLNLETLDLVPLKYSVKVYGQ